MADVFISYKREEKARVERIAQGLCELGLSVWFDANLATGGAFHEEIDREVQAARCVLVCWTPEAVSSRWVMGEAQIGLDRGVLVPVFLAPVRLPSPFNTLHTSDLSGWTGAHGDPAWLALLDAIGAHVGRAGLRHVALALAGREPVRVMGEDVAMLRSSTLGRTARVSKRVEPPVSSLSPNASPSEFIGFTVRRFSIFLLKLVAVMVFGGLALWRMKRWVLLSLWVGVFVAVFRGQSELVSYDYWGEYANSGLNGLVTCVVVGNLFASLFSVFLMIVVSWFPRSIRAGFARGLGFGRKA